MVRRSRTPQGVRGLKPLLPMKIFNLFPSHSARSAWIETYFFFQVAGRGISRTPQGVRGLKLEEDVKTAELLASHSARSAWIETCLSHRSTPHTAVALRKECVD